MPINPSRFTEEADSTEDQTEKNRRDLQEYLGAGGTEENYDQFKVRARRERLALVFVAVVGITILLVGFFQMKNILAVPFPGSAANAPVATKTPDTATVPLANQSTDQLKKQDTDDDGISDFDELYVYKTSPYLADTDSDGISDYDEIKAGTDPNCPEGQKCFLSSSPNATDVGATNTPGTVTPAIVRALLLKSGNFTVAQLQPLDDQAIMDIYNEAIASDPALKQKLEESLGGVAAATPNTTPASLDAVTKQAESASIADIKAMLVNQGIAAADLDKIDDATLRKLYLQVLSQTKSAFDQSQTKSSTTK